MRRRALALAFGSMVLAGCGGAGQAPTAPSAAGASNEPEVASGSTLTDFQKKRLLGHYSTMDGATGFILDRTVTPWRGKLDGVDKVVTLNETNEPRRGVKEYTSADRSMWLRVESESGDVQLFQGPKQTEGVPVQRDADAERLPRP
jgi:hypothetical protein